MKKKNVKERKIDILYDNTIDLLKIIKFHFFTRDKSLIIQNKRYKSIHKGHRCFILGNGPSVSKFDLSVLKDEIVFCVNEFFRYERYKEVGVDYYFLADPAYFSEVRNIEDKEFSDAINKISNEDTEIWIPFSFRKDVEKREWNKKSIRYYNNNLTWVNQYKKSIRFDKCIPQMQAVIQYAILLAIYMGFSEIYLLGVEQTDIFSSLNSYLEKNVQFQYAFRLDDNIREWKRQQILEYSLADLLAGYSKIFDLYDEIAEYCARNGFKIYNCSPGSLIKSIPFKEWSEIDFINNK